MGLRNFKAGLGLPPRMNRARTCVALAVSATVALAGSPAQAARPLTLGFFDPALTDTTPGGSALRTRASSYGSEILRVMVGWGGVAPTRPDRPGDPGDPAYRWDGTDETVRQLASSGQTILMNLTGPPAWAQQSVPKGPRRESWDPSPAAFAAFARAAAERYSGRHPDPLNPGRLLPRIRYWQAWNEPNLQSNLNPQWRDGKPYTPGLYRRLLNGFYDSVNAVHTDNVVVTAGLGPFGDPNPGGRIMPVRFWRELLQKKTRFDIWSHHPYGVREPSSPALNADDAAVADVYKLRRVIEQARRRGRLVSRKRPPSWVTEVSYDSSPPDPDGVPAQLHARWLEEAFYLLWKQGVSVVTWFRMVDQPPVPSFGLSNQSGILLLDGTPKPAATAYRFPFVTERVGPARVRLWGKAPAAGDVRVERRDKGRWKPVRTVAPGANRIFQVSTALAGKHLLRARQGGDVSLTWKQSG